MIPRTIEDNLLKKCFEAIQKPRDDSCLHWHFWFSYTVCIRLDNLEQRTTQRHDENRMCALWHEVTCLRQEVMIAWQWSECMRMLYILCASSLKRQFFGEFLYIILNFRISESELTLLVYWTKWSSLSKNTRSLSFLSWSWHQSCSPANRVSGFTSHRNRVNWKSRVRHLTIACGLRRVLSCGTAKTQVKPREEVIGMWKITRD